MKDGIYMMLSGNFRCRHLLTKTFGLVNFRHEDEPAITVTDNSKEWKRKIDLITSSAEYDIVEKT